MILAVTVAYVIVMLVLLNISLSASGCGSSASWTIVAHLLWPLSLAVVVLHVLILSAANTRTG